MSASLRITLRDVARACGVHASTICLALKNSPSISVATRQRVQAAAQELGYRPNVAASNLAMLRGDRRAYGSLPIAWINQEPQRHHWRTNEEARIHFEHASRRAGQLGYHLEEIWTHGPEMRPSRLVQIVRTRGIEGVIFPVHRHFEFSLLEPAWDEFALVGLNDYRLAERVDVVCPDYYSNSDTAFRRIAQLGIGRVGLVLAEGPDVACHELVHSCYLRHQAQIAPAERLPVCFLPEPTDARHGRFFNWFQACQPQVVVSGDAGLVRAARCAGLAALWIGLASGAFPFDGGIEGPTGDAAVAAVDCLVEKIRRFEQGRREFSRVHLTRSGWVAPRMGNEERRAVVA